MHRIFIFLSFVPFFTFGNVAIEYKGNILSYADNPKLDTVLSNLVRRTEYYWPNAALFDLEDNQSARLKRKVLDELASMKSKSGRKTKKWRDIDGLLEQVRRWKVAKRVPLYIDFDLARVNEKFNPRLDDGKYFLNLPFRDNQITVFGAIAQETRLNHIGGGSIKDYLSQLELADYADSEFVYVIKPNGEYVKVSLGVHNARHIEVSPGGSVYIPIKELPFLSTNEKLNDMIATLAGSRLP